eukprot:c26777_g1_i1 orf=1-1347(-)
MGSSEEPERKRRHIANNSTMHSGVSNSNSFSSAVKKQPADDKKVDTSMLQYQNQRLAQQRDAQRIEIHDLENKINQLRSKQVAYDNSLASIHNAWDELVDNLEILAVRANASTDGLKVLQSSICSKDVGNVFISSEDTFLYRLLETGATESSSGKESDISIESALKNRQDATIWTMEHLVEAIDGQRGKNEEFLQSLNKVTFTDDVEWLLQKIDEDITTELKNLRSAMAALHLKHKELASEIRTYHDNHTRDQAETKRLAGELEEVLADLETSRRKLAALKNEKDDFLSVPRSILGIKSETGDKSSRELKELEASTEEAKTLASQRFNELQELQQEKVALSQQLQKIQDSLNDEQHILSSRPYVLLNDQVQRLKAEVNRYQSLMDQSQAERDSVLICEKEATLRAEAGEEAQRENILSSARLAELESKLQQCMAERNELQIKLEEISQS